MALSILRALQSHGWRVPEQLSVAGIDDITLAEYATPALTTLRLPRRAMAQLAVASLQEMIENSEVTAPAQTVTPRLILRESVGQATR
jgi:DNA-binding LacI/PurR family transcriptional regulator